MGQAGPEKSEAGSAVAGLAAQIGLVEDRAASATTIPPGDSMVIGRQFAWAHLPKAGGDATLSLFLLFPELILSADPPQSTEKHLYFHSHEQEVRGKTLALNIRRLPSWMLSFAQHKAAHGLYPDFEPLPLDSPAQMAASSIADIHLESYLDRPIDRWLRVECLVDDFLGFISTFTQVTPDAERQARSLGRVNSLTYEHDIWRWFSDAEVVQMYERNPTWRRVEEQVYGSLPFRP